MPHCLPFPAHRVLPRLRTHIIRRTWQIVSTISCVALLALSGQQGRTEDAFRDDFGSIAPWKARPEWISPHTDTPQAEADSGVGRFSVPDQETGMKWSRAFEMPVEPDMTPWLVIRYRAINIAQDRLDYFVWLEGSGNDHGGVNVLKGDAVQADNQWHTTKVHLPEAGVASPVTGIAVQCFANGDGNAELWVDYLAITDLPPEEADEHTPISAPASVTPIDLRHCQQWTIQPDWLGNFTQHHDQSVTDSGRKFSVRDGMKGAKWSFPLPQPLSGQRYVALRYRARNTRAWGDYVLYASSGGPSPQEQNLIREGELSADGDWHVAVTRVELSEIRLLAVQVQALRDDAFLEIAELKFSDQRPEVKLTDTFESVAGWPALGDTWRVVNLPPGNMSSLDLARKLGASGTLPAGELTVSGVPLLVRGGTDAVHMTPLSEPGQIDVPLSGQAAEAYLLLAAQFPQRDEPSYAGTAGQISHVHRLVARITYDDGSREDQFPFSVSAGKHAVSHSLRVYALALDPTKPLKTISLIDGMQRGAFGLVGLTLCRDPGPATAATQLQANPTLASQHSATAQSPATQSSGIEYRDDCLTISSQTIRMILRLKPGLMVQRVENLTSAETSNYISAGPLFRILGDGFELSSDQFEIQSVTPEPDGQGTTLRLDLQHRSEHRTIAVGIWVDVRDPQEIGLRAHIELPDADKATTSFLFPELREITLGGPLSDCWIWCPRRGDVITSAAVSLREPYAGAGNPLQIIGTFDPRRGTGLYLMTQDLEARSKFYHVEKSSEGARLAIEYTPLHESDSPRTVIGCSQGDWHAQFARYQQWVNSWYQPAATRQPWFRQVWNFRQQFMHFALPVKSGIFDEASKTIKLKEVVETDARAFGGVDYLHLFDWGWDPVHGRCGDYQPWDYLGGVASFRQAVDEVTSQGIPVGLYLEGILVDPQSEIGKAHGASWQMLGPSGKPYEYFAPSFHICPHVTEWQTYLSDTYQRVAEQTGARGFYIDEYGFSGPTYWCYNPTHGHPIPVTPVLGERAMLQQVRKKLGDSAAIYTEESPTDVNSQYQDGSFTYNISSVMDEWSPSHVNLYRFAFPSFKTIEIICCDQPLGTNVEAVKRCLFNGEAIWIEGIWDRWFAPEVRAQIALNHRILQSNRECFTSDYVAPLVPTLLSGLYANRFDERDDRTGKTCWTIYNTNYRTVRAEVIAVDTADGAEYQNEMDSQAVAVRVAGPLTYLTLEIPPREVVVVSRQVHVE